MKTLFVKPAPGLLVRHPGTGQPLAAEGEDVTAWRTHFHRQLAAGDVVLVEPAKPADPPKPAPHAPAARSIPRE